MTKVVQGHSTSRHNSRSSRKEDLRFSRNESYGSTVNSEIVTTVGKNGRIKSGVVSNSPTKMRNKRHSSYVENSQDHDLAKSDLGQLERVSRKRISSNRHEISTWV